MRSGWETLVQGGGGRLRAVATLAAVALVLALAAQASAHVERAGYWPDPAPDRSVTPQAGGSVPAARSLFTALNRKPAGVTRVVCQGRVPSPRRVRTLTRAFRSARRSRASRARIAKLRRRLRAAKRSYRRGVGRNASIRRLRAQIKVARTSGYRVRPSQPAVRISRRQGARLLSFNERLLGRCRYASIQDAVTRSRNNDRVVIMPGVYTEPKSRARPSDDPACADLKLKNDRPNNSGAVSYGYQVKCPNGANLIAVIGRAPGSGTDPATPRLDRRGIPNLGPCIRCNLQMEGSGVGPDDVVVDAGRVESGNKGPIGAKKDVGIRADRADGFVLRNVTVRHAREHDIYVLETDGYRVERFKAFYGGEYGFLTFVNDHGLIQDCSAAGNGDSGLYPGASPDTGDATTEGRRRYNQELRNCDSYHNASGYSGTSGNAIWVHDNNFYGNALGFTTDVFTAAGHPGFPQDSDLVENNNFYSNNFNPYLEGSDVVPSVPVPVGTGMWIAGGNHNIVRNNRFWDNWRRGAMLFAVPDAFVCGPATGNTQAGCDPAKLSTSYNNLFTRNSMGRDPAGRPDPNGTDFWWDQFAGNTGNCWQGNTGKDGTPGSVTSLPGTLPANCKSSIGTGGPAQESELLNCLGDIEAKTGTCPWFVTPVEPKP